MIVGEICYIIAHMKVKHQNLDKKQKIKTLDTLYTAAATMYGRETMKLFLRDLLTESERVMLGRRIMIAQKLLSRQSYGVIRADLGVSFNTIAKVHRWLEDQFPGYEKAVRGLEEEIRKRQQRFESRKTLATLKRKYPLHFLLFPWPKGFGPKKFPK